MAGPAARLTPLWRLIIIVITKQQQEIPSEEMMLTFVGAWILLSAVILLAIFKVPMMVFLLIVLPFWAVVCTGFYFLLKE